MTILKKETIFQDITKLKGVGSILSKYLKKKRIEKIKDIIFNLPYSETDRSKISKLNEYYNEFNAGGDLIFEDFYEFEVKYLVKEEMARTSEDILFRRTKLGINIPKEAKDKLEIILKRHL